MAHRDGEADDERRGLREVGGGEIGFDQAVGSRGGEEGSCVEAGGEGELGSVGAD